MKIIVQIWSIVAICVLGAAILIMDKRREHQITELVATQRTLLQSDSLQDTQIGVLLWDSHADNATWSVIDSLPQGTIFGDMDSAMIIADTNGTYAMYKMNGIWSQWIRMDAPRDSVPERSWRPLIDTIPWILDPVDAPRDTNWPPPILENQHTLPDSSEVHRIAMGMYARRKVNGKWDDWQFFADSNAALYYLSGF